MGFALGIERVIALSKKGARTSLSPDIFIATVGEPAKRRVIGTLTALRDAGIKVETDYDQGSLKSQMRRADKLGAQYTVILGDDELAKGLALVRDMATKSQTEVALGGLVSHLVTLLASPRRA